MNTSFLENNDLINNTLDYYLDFKNTSNNYSFLTINDQSNLANSAFMILSLLNSPDYPNQELLLEEFAEVAVSDKPLSAKFMEGIAQGAGAAVDVAGGLFN